MEYFIGIVPPESYQEKVSAFQRRWPEGHLPHFVEPHVTVKAQNGLDESVAWLERVRAVCAGTEPFKVTLGEPDGFGERVLFLNVASPGVYALHRQLLEAVNPPVALRVRYFEGEAFHAHLTLGVAGQGVTVEDLAEMKRLAPEQLQPYPRFTVEFVRVYQYDGTPGGGYRKLVDVKLGGE